MRRSVIDPQKSYTFRDYFQLNIPVDELVTYFGYTHNDLFGAVSIGNVWQFGILHRQHKQFVQDLNLFRVPTDLDDLLQVLVAILDHS